MTSFAVFALMVAGKNCFQLKLNNPGAIRVQSDEMNLTANESNLMVASLIWGSVGGGYFLYGKKQMSSPAMAGGAAIIVVSYFVESALWMSLASIGIMGGIYWWSRHAD